MEYTQQKELEDKITKLLNEKKSARDFQLRKHDDWNENYELYRNKVKTNRLTQRQAVNIPLMKETIKTLISKSDDAPSVDWKENSGDQMKELIYQEIWDNKFKHNKIEWLDIMDKKNVFLYGLSTKKLNIDDTGISINVMDCFNVIYDPLMDPMDIETARFIIHQNIFRPLRDILVDERYSTEGKDKLKHWADSDTGLVQSGLNKEEFEKSQERLQSMGVESQNFALFAGGDVMVNLTEHYTNIWNQKTKKFDRRVIVYADDQIELCDDSLKECTGVETWPFVVWSEDPETNDIYPDGIADLVRVPNKILNIWFSQQVENRTLQNFQMHWFDATNQGYIPQTYEPGPGRMLPAPGNPNDTIKAVEINGLDETFTAINYLTAIVERGSGAVALDKGVSETGQQTLGEVQLIVGKATERSKTMAKFYKGSWYELAKKWDAMMQANTFKKMSLYKTGQDGKVYEKVVYNADWKSDAGYEPTVASSSEQESDELNSIKKFGFVQMQYPNNLALRKIIQKRTLGILDLTAQELKEIEEEEKKLSEQADQMAMQPQQQIQAEQMQPVGQTMKDINNQLATV